MAYITLANTKKIIFNSNIKGLDLSGELYKIPIYFFSKYEKNALLAIQELLKNPEEYFYTIYKPYTPVDTYTYVYDGKHPSYHSTPNCPRLNAKYENFEIPSDIREKGADVVKSSNGLKQSNICLKDQIFLLQGCKQDGVLSQTQTQYL